MNGTLFASAAIMRWAMLIAWRRLRADPGRMVLTAVGVGLGVALMLGIQIVNRSFLDSFHRSMDELTGRPGLQVVGGPTGIAEDLLSVIRDVPAVEVAAPMVVARATTIGARRPVTVFGIDTLSEQRVQSVKLVPGKDGVDDPIRLLTDARSILITEELSTRLGLRIGDALDLVLPSGREAFTVRGLLRVEGIARLYGGDLAVMDVAYAQRWFSKEGRYDQIDVLGTAEADLEQMRADLVHALGPGFRVERPTTRTERTERFFRSIELVLLLIGFLGMAGGGFIIYGMMTVEVARARHDTATLRCLGVRSRDIVWLTVAQAALVGLLGSVLGVAAGSGLAFALVNGIRDVLSGINPLVQVPRTAIRLDWWLPLWAAFLGSTVAVVGAVRPAWVARRIAPLAALRQQKACDVPSGARVSRLAMAGAAALCVGVVALVVILSSIVDQVPEALLGADLVFFVGYLALTPGVVAFGAIVAAWLLRNGRMPNALLAARLLISSPRHYGPTACLLEVGLALFVVVAVCMRSAQGGILDWTSRAIQEDLVAYSPQGATYVEGGRLEASLLDRIRSVPGVARVIGSHLAPFELGDRSVVLRAVDVARAADGSPIPDFYFPSPLSAEDLEAFVSGGDTVLVSEQLARDRGVAPGDSLSLDTPHGARPFRVAGLVVDWTADLLLVIPRAAFVRHWGDESLTAVGVMATDATRIEQVREAILTNLGEQYQLNVITGQQARAEYVHAVRESFTFSAPLQIYVLLACAVGLLLTLLAWTLDHQRLLATLRAVGATRAQVARVVVTQAIIVTLATAAWGVCSGLEISARWVRLVFRYLLGYPLPWDVPLLPVASATVLALGIAALAAYYPSRQAARCNIAGELAHE
jgi:putative ABC transport system permease protein